VRRSLPVARLVWGGLLVTAPRTVLRVLTDGAGSEAPVIRVLGARHVAQAAVELARPTPATLRVGAAVDLLHATTCAAAVACSPTWRRPALIDGIGAVVLATGGLIQAGSA
jgi:hypothetical protein